MNSHGQVERLLPLRPHIVVSDKPAELREMVRELTAREWPEAAH